MKLRRKKDQAPTGRNPVVGKKSPVFSYYSNRSNNSETPQHTRAPINQSSRNDSSKQTWVNYLPSLIAFAVVVFSGIYLTTLTTSPKIQVINGDNATVVSRNNEAYQKSAQDILQSSVFNRSKLLINSDKVASELKQRYPELGDVVVTVPLISRRPIIQMQFARPAFILSSNQGMYVIDTTGRPVMEASQVQSSISDKLPLVADESNTAVELGKQLVTTEFVQFIQGISAQFEAQKVEVESYTLPAIANELHVRPNGVGYIVKFNTEEPAREQVGTYLAVRDKLKNDGVTPSEYIDVRVSERAYYK